MEIEAFLSRAWPAIEAVDGEALESLYDECRKSAWSLIRSCAASSEVEAWREGTERALAFISRVEFARSPLALFAARLQVIQDLLAEEVFFESRHPADEVLERTHVRPILTALLKHRGRMPRAALLKVTELGTANLSRVLRVMEMSRLIRRKSVGQNEVDVLVTAYARELMNAKLAGPEMPVFNPVDYGAIQDATILSKPNPSFDSLTDQVSEAHQVKIETVRQGIAPRGIARMSAPQRAATVVRSTSVGLGLKTAIKGVRPEYATGDAA
jgi:hypothetical protein